MKKFLFAFAAATMLLGVSSCKSDSNKQEAAPAEETQVEGTTQATPPMSPAEYNLKAGAAYIDSLKQNDSDVYFTESGLGYKVLKDGKGKKPTLNDVALVKYTGMHLDGSVFDSSGENVVPFPLTQVIPGFSEGLQLMPEGATYRLYIPSNIAYGPRGAGGAIAPNETLIFDLELVGIQ